MEPKMKYEYTAYCSNEEERIELIANDILREYPNLKELAKEAARMETPFGKEHEDRDRFSDQENQINRLINIIIVTEGKQEFFDEYQKACRELIKSYNSWKHNYTYSNPEAQTAYTVVQSFLRHLKDGSEPLLTFENVIKQSEKSK